MINEDYVLENFVEGDISVEVKVDYANNTVCLSQKDMSVLFNTTRNNISMHISNINKKNNDNSNPTSKDFLQVQNEEFRTVNRKIKHYNLDVILAVGYKCNSEITAIFNVIELEKNRVVKENFTTENI